MPFEFTTLPRLLTDNGPRCPRRPLAPFSRKACILFPRRETRYDNIYYIATPCGTAYGTVKRARIIKKSYSVVVRSCENSGNSNKCATEGVIGGKVRLGLRRRHGRFVDDDTPYTVVFILSVFRHIPDSIENVSNFLIYSHGLLNFATYQNNNKYSSAYTAM